MEFTDQVDPVDDVDSFVEAMVEVSRIRHHGDISWKETQN